MLNKIDRVDEIGRRRLGNRFPDAPQVSAATGEGLEELKARLAEQFASRWERVRLLVPYADGAAPVGAVRARRADREREDTPEGVLVVARLPRRDLRAVRAFLVAEADAGDGLIELPVQRLRDDAVLPARAYAGDAGLDLVGVRARRARAGRARARRHRARGRDPGRATRASSSRARASRRSTASRS